MHPATQQLRDEHEGIKIMLRVLEVLADRAREGTGFDTGDAGKIIEFLRVFADTCHHGKEEEFLFPALEAAGIPRQGGPVGVMLEEHESGRAFIKAMSEALAAGDRQAFAQAATNYATLLNAHIQKENEVLFKMAEGVLSPQEQEQLFTCFERIEEERIGPGVHEAFHALIDTLAAKYLAGEG